MALDNTGREARALLMAETKEDVEPARRDDARRQASEYVPLWSSFGSFVSSFGSFVLSFCVHFFFRLI
jgi:hypothetical protein